MRMILLLTAMTGSLLLALYSPHWRNSPHWRIAPSAPRAMIAPAVERIALPYDAAASSGFANAVASAAPCVVTVIPEIRVGDPELGHLMPDGATVCRGIGSGVILRSDGYILTNNHVVELADSITVVLADGEGPLPARVVGRDAETDLAVLKIEAAAELPAISRADSDSVGVGDLVLAIGNPFGIGPTVSQGIVSAVNRGFGIADLEDYVQTDAAINLGCSGGALVDSGGRLIGINTAIFSPTGGNTGIGFAISANLATSIAERLIIDGSIVRGSLGITVHCTPHSAAKDAGAATRGVQIEDVESSGPSASGLRTGDIIVAVDLIAVRSPQQLQLQIARNRPGDRVAIDLLRDNEPMRVEVKLEKRRSVVRELGILVPGREGAQTIRTAFSL